MNSPDGSFSSTEVEVASSPVATSGSQVDASPRSVMFDTLVKEWTRKEDNDRVETSDDIVTGREEIHDEGSSAVVMSEEPHTLKDADSVPEVEKPGCSGACKAMVAIKFRGLQDTLSPDSKLVFSSSPVNDSVVIIDSD